MISVDKRLEWVVDDTELVNCTNLVSQKYQFTLLGSVSKPWSQSNEINLVLKKSKLVLNSLWIRYFN